MSIIALIALIPLIILLTIPELPQEVLIILFAVEFLLIGISTTCIIYPLLKFSEVTRKVLVIVSFSIIFSLLSILITMYLLKTKISNFVLLLSAMTIIISSIALLRQDRVMSQHNEQTLDVIQKNIYNVIFLCIISIIGVFVPPFNKLPLWEGLCLPFILFLPGYYLINAIIPQMDELSFLERSVTAIVLSTVITSIIGIIIIEIKGSLNVIYLTLCVILLTIIILIYYVSRIKKIDAEDRFYYKKYNHALTLITVIALLGVIISGIYIQDEMSNDGNTTFEIEGLNKTASENGYVNFTNGEEVILNLNITNHQYEDKNYTVKIEIFNETTNRMFSEQNISLKNNESITIPANITMSPGSKDIHFILYENGKPYIIRHLYVTVSEDSAPQATDTSTDEDENITDDDFSDGIIEA